MSYAQLLEFMAPLSTQSRFHGDQTVQELPPGIPARFRTSDASAVRLCSGPVVPQMDQDTGDHR